MNTIFENSENCYKNKAKQWNEEWPNEEQTGKGTTTEGGNIWAEEWEDSHAKSYGKTFRQGWNCAQKLWHRKELDVFEKEDQHD